MRLPPFLLLIAGGCLMTVSAADGTLNRAKAEVRPAPKPAPAARSSSSSTSRHTRDTRSMMSSASASQAADDGDSFLGAIVEALGFTIAGSAKSVVPDGGPFDVGVVGRPYAQGHPGYLGDARGGGPASPFGAQVMLDAGVIERDLQRYGIGGRLWLTGTLQIDTEYLRYYERRATGGHDTLTVGCSGLSLGFPITSHGHLHIGGGVVSYHDNWGTEAGPALVGGLDIFPLRPLVLSAAGCIGSINNDPDEESVAIRMLRASLGACFDRYEVFAGWQSTWIGQVQLDGPMAGVRVWF